MRRLLPLLLVLPLLGAAPPPTAAPPAAPSIDVPLRSGASRPADAAVVIGNETYPFVATVPYARADAEAFADLLVYTRGVPREHVRLLTETTAERVLTAVREAAADVGPGGHLWVFFAGHGGMDPQTGDRLLLMKDVDADPASFRSRAVSVRELHALAGPEPIFVIDACFNGTMRGGGALVPPDKRWVTVDYATDAPPPGVEWAATHPQEAAGAWAAVGHGRFTFFAVGALRGWADGELDAVRDGMVTANEADAYVARMLRVARVTDQRPLLRGTSRDLVLAGGSGVRLELPPGEEGFGGTSGSTMALAPAVSQAPTPLPPSRPGLADEGLPGLGDEVVAIAGGPLGRVATDGSAPRDGNPETPDVEVGPLFVARTEVTQKLYAQFRSGGFVKEIDGESLEGDDLPAQGLSWCDAVAFANWMTLRSNSTLGTGLTLAYSGIAECEASSSASVVVVPGATGWRLPTLVEWLHASAALAAAIGRDSGDAATACRYGNIDDHYWKGHTASTKAPCRDGIRGLSPVASFEASSDDLYDMLGNVREWVWDRMPRCFGMFGQTLDGAVCHYTAGEAAIPFASYGDFDLLFPGSWPDLAPDSGKADLGLRLVRSKGAP